MIPRILRRGKAFHLVAVLWLMNPAALLDARGQEQVPPALQFQRITIPEGRIDDVVGEFVATKRDDFRNAVAELNAKYRALYGPAKPKIVRAAYTARFENQELVDGSAKLDIKLPHSEPSFLPLAPLGLAVESLQWEGDPNREVAAGLLSTGDMGVLVSRSDTLMFSWSLRASSETDQSHRFSLSLPEATTNELLLDLPSGLVPECANALISQTGNPMARDAGAVDTVRWRIELGATRETELRLVPTHEDAARDRLVMAWPAYDYRVSTTGLDLRASFRLDIQRQPLRQLLLQVDPRLRLAAVRLNGDTISYAPGAGTGEETAFVLEPPTSLGAGPHELTVTANAPVVENQRWQLPRLALVDVLWREGTASLDVSEPLRIDQLSWHGSVLRSAEPLPSPASGESRQFDLLAPDAAWDVLLTRRNTRLSAMTGTTITLNDAMVASQFVARLSATRGAVFSIPLQRDAGWIVDSIETDPPQIDHVEVLRGSRGLSREVILRTPVTPENPIQLLVSAHRRLPASGALAGLDMRPVSLGEGISTSRLTAVRAELPLQLDVSGDAGLTRVTELSPLEKPLIAADGNQLVYRDGPNADRVRVVLRSQPPRYSGAIVTEALVESGKIRQSFVFRCEQMSTPIGVLRIRFSPAPSENIQWSAVGEGSGELSATKLDAKGEEWEVRLRRPRSVPFEIQATLLQGAVPASVPSSTEPETIVLASLPDAEAQVGTVSVGTPDGSDFSLHPVGLKAIPMPPVDATRLPSRRAAFRYAPAQDVVLQLTRHGNQLDPPDAWIWDAEITSRVEAGGVLTHVAVLRVENVGVSRLTMDLPPGVKLERVEVDGERVVASPIQSRLRIPLPPQQRFPTVRLRYKQVGPPLGNYRRLRVVMPEFDLRCLNRSWRVWVPPDYKSIIGGGLDELARTPLQRTRGIDWEQRLFGVAILRRTGRPWDLTSLWSRADDAAPPSRELETKQRLQDLLGAMDSQLRAAGDPGATMLSWGQLLARSLAAVSEGRHALPLYVDREAMSSAGILATATVPSQARSALTALRLHDLVFVRDDKSLILTTLTAQAAGKYGPCTSIAERTFVTDQGIEGSSRLVLATDWRGDFLLWHDAGTNPSFTPLVGWTNMQFRPAGEQATIVLCRSELVDAVGWAFLFVAVACGMWLGRRGSLVLLSTVVLSMLAGLLAPIGLVLIFRSVFLGLLAAVALVSLRRRVVARPPRRQSDDSLSIRMPQAIDSVTVGLVLVAVLFAAATRITLAQDRPVYRVYDPVDEEGQPTGPHLYVSRSLFESLDKLKMTLGTQQFGAILTAANYSLVTADAPMATMLPELQAEFQLVGFNAGAATIRVPFERDELQVVEAMFDGRRVYPRWSQDGQRLELDVEILDHHTLQFTLRPVLNSDADGSGFDLRIPTIPNSRLSIRGRDVTMIKPESSLGAIIRTEDTVEARIGPVDRLTVHWPVSSPRNPTPVEFTASQLTWVRAESSVIAVDTQFTFSVLAGELNEVELIVDPRLQLLATDNQAQVSESLTPDNAFRKIRYRLNKGYEPNEIVTIRPSFVMTDVGVNGFLNRPLIRVATGAVRNPLLAVSTSPGIAASLTYESDWPTVRPQDFAETWGTMRLPKEVIQLPSSESDWSLAISSREARLGNSDATEIRIGRQRADITHDSQIQIAAANVLQLALQVPQGMNVGNVSVVQDDVDFVRRYAQSPDGTLTIFLTGPVQGEVQLALDGSLSLPSRGQFAYAGIRLLDSVTSTRQLTVFRRAEVLVQASTNTPHRLLELPREHRWSGQARVVGIYDLSDKTELATPDITLNIAPNPARFSGSLVTALNSQEAQWFVNANLSLQVSQGVVDFVRVRLPRELTETLRLDPPMPYEVRDVPGQSDPTLLILPPVTIDKEFQVALTARLQTSPDGSISAPAIELLDTAQVERFLVLPKRSGEQEIEWDIRGLEQPESDESQTTYRVRGRRLRAVVREVNPSAGSPRLLLTDIEVAWQTNDAYVGVVSFDLEPGALTKCDLIIPDHVDLLHATVDDSPALLKCVDATRATLDLGAARLPQRIAILFTGRASSLATVDRSMTIAAPSLRGLDTRRTLWSVRNPPTHVSSVPLLKHSITSAAAARRLRIGTLREILQYNVGPVPQHRSHDLQRWREHWQARLDEMTAKPHDMAELATASIVSFRDATAWGTTGGGNDWTYCSFDGPTPTLTILSGNPDYAGFLIRASIAFATCVLAWCLFKLSRCEAVRDVFSRWPHCFGILTGLAWWLWLSPSAVGWLIVLAFLASSLRPVWRSRVVRTMR